MAENDQEKTEQKSQKKWEQARDKGELPRSQEISTFSVFLFVILYFSFHRTYWFEGIGRVMADLLRLSPKRRARVQEAASRAPQ